MDIDQYNHTSYYRTVTTFVDTNLKCIKLRKIDYNSAKSFFYSFQN